MEKEPFGRFQSESSQDALRKFLIGGFSQEYTALTDLLRKFSEREDSREQCHRLLAENVQQLHGTLQSHTQFQAAFQEAAACSPLEHYPWRFHLLAESALIRMGLLTIFRALPIPLHDHPDSFGAQCVLSGKVRVRQYDLKDGLEYSQKHVVTLRQTLDEELAIGFRSTYLSNHRNIHGLESVVPRSIMLSMMIHPPQESGGNWYYPASLNSGSRDRICTRIRRRRRISPD